MTEAARVESFDIPGVTLREVIGRGSHSLVYRATREGRTYAVKVQRPDVSDRSGEAALRFRREASVLACLRHPGLPTILELGETDGRPYIVQEFVSGRTLTDIIADGPLEEAKVVAIAKRLAGALAEVHKRGMVHCDVKPDNVLIDDSGGARLIDFGFAVRASGHYEHESVMGTLLYSAPEQSGMLKRPVDGRSDLYSLGVVLFECATGAPPFSHEEAGELVRQHAAVPAPDARQTNPGVTPALAAVIDKLLAKDPDDRYQSRGGLVGDLDRLEELSVRMRVGDDAPLGVFDAHARAFVELPLVGRDREMERLLRAWERTGPRGTAVLITGESGSGRSRLAAELVRRARAATSVAMVGRCSDARLLPFESIREAVDDAIATLGRLGPEQREAAKERLRNAAGGSAPLLRRLSPALSSLLGAASGAADLEGLHDQYYDALAQLFVRYAGASRRALIVLEDVEWLDDGSLQVLSRLAVHVAQTPLMLVLTASSEAKARTHVDSLLEDLGPAPMIRIELPPLDDEAVGALVAAQLGDPDQDLPFVARIAARSKGSPLAATEHVRAMLDAGLLRPSWGTWVVDEAGLEDLDLPSDLVAIAVRRIGALGDGARAVLEAASVVGGGFDVSLLGAVVGVSDVAVHEALAEGVREGLLERGVGGGHTFVHREVRAALMSSLEPDVVTSMHQRIAEALDDAGGAMSERLFAMARHYALGDVAATPERAVLVNIAAGRKALEEHAHEQALSFLEEAERCSSEVGVPLPEDVGELFGEVAARTGRLAEAIERFEATLERAPRGLAKAQLRARLAHTHVANFHTGSAWREVQAGFADLGSPFPRWIPAGLPWTLASWLRGMLADRFGIGFGRASDRDRPRLATYVELCEYGAIQAYFASRPLLLLQLVLRHFLAATRLGKSAALVASYCQQAVGFAVLGMRRAALGNIDKAVALSGELGDRLILARAHVYHGFVLHLCGDSIEAEGVARRALEKHGEWLDALHFLDGSGDLVFNLLLRGYFADAWVWVERQLVRLRFTSGGVQSRQGNPWAGPLLAALGRTAEAVEVQQITREFVEGAPRTETYLWGELLSYRVLFLLEQGETGEPLDRAIEEHRQLGLRPSTASFHMRSFYVFQAIARMEQAQVASSKDLPRALERLRAALGELDRAVMIPAMGAHGQVVRGAMHRLAGQDDRARWHLDAADQLAREVDSPWVRYEVARQRAFLLRAKGRRVPAEREARVALSLALEHGWRLRARKIRSELGVGGTSRLSRHSSSVTTSRERSRAGSLKLRRHLDALLQVSSAAASVLDPDRQARIALDEVVRILGAERAFLFGAAEDSKHLEFLAGRDSDGGDLDQPRGFSSTVVETVRREDSPLIVSGTEEGEVIGSESVVTHDLRSIVAAPLRVRDQSVGVLYLDSRLARGVFTEEDVEILLAIGSHIAIALETSRAAQLEIRYEAEARRRELAEGLRDMSHALSSTLNLDEVLERLVQGVAQVLPHDGVSVLLLEDGRVRRAASTGSIGEDELDVGVALHLDPVLADVVDRRTPEVIEDVTVAGRVPERAAAPGTRAWLAAPLISHDRTAGVLVLESSRPGTYTDHEAEVAFAFAGQAGIAIENARLFGEVQRLATTDELTGLLNRRHFFALAEREHSQARRKGRALSAIMIDVDHFKRINDEHGHAVGDQVLKELAGRCQRSVRDVDVLGRYGGEEFAIVLPETDLETAATRVAERLRQAVSEEPVKTRHGDLRVTISLGVAQMAGGSVDLAALLDRADGAMYAAKAAGRNRVSTGEVEGEAE